MLTEFDTLQESAVDSLIRFSLARYKLRKTELICNLHKSQWMCADRHNKMVTNKSQDVDEQVLKQWTENLTVMTVESTIISYGLNVLGYFRMT